MVLADPPVLVAHRANDLDRARAAVAAGFRWVEVDVRLSADGVLVAHHDPVVAGGEIAALPAARTGLMRLEELLAALPAGVGVDVDVKSALADAARARGATAAAAVAEAVRHERERRPLLVTSFDPAALLVVRERAPEVPLGWLTWFGFPFEHAVAAAAHLGVDVVAPQHGSADERGIAAAHAAGLEVLAWCPRAADAARLAAAGADGLVVDRA